MICVITAGKEVFYLYFFCILNVSKNIFGGILLHAMNEAVNKHSSHHEELVII